MEDFQVPEDINSLASLQTEKAGRFCASANILGLQDDSAEELNDRTDDLGSKLEDGELASLADQENFDEAFAFVR